MDERKENTHEQSSNNPLEDSIDIESYKAHSDSLDFSNSDNDSRCYDDGFISTSLKSIISDSSSWTPSLSFPDSYMGDMNYDDDLLADINLPSIGDSPSARKLISLIAHANGEQERQVLDRLSTSEKVSTNRGHSALKVLGEELRTAKEETTELRLEITRLKEALSSVKDDVEDLDIGDGLYSKLCQMRRDEMTVKEVASLSAARIYMPLRKELIVCRRDLDETQVALEVSSTTVQSLQEGLARARKQASTSAESSRLDLMAAEERAGRLANRLEEETQRRRECEDAADRCLRAEKEAQELRKEADTLRRTLEEQSTVLQSLSASESRLKDLYSDCNRAKEMLSLDKAFLQKELGESVTKANEQARVVDAQREKIQSLDTKVSELTDQLVAVQQSTRSAFDDRMEREVKRLRDDYEREMASLKESSREIAERENRVLREVRTSLEKECETLRRRINEKEEEVNTLSRELSSTCVSKDTEISSLRAELKMKCFEATSLGATYEERVSQLRATQLELDVLKEEVSVHRSALLRMEAEADSKEVMLRESLARAHETIRAYELLLAEEGSSDNVRGRESDRITGEENDTNGNRPKLAVSVLASDPRRLRNLLDVSERNAARATAQEARIAELEVKVEELDKERANLEEKLQASERSLSLVDQPRRYLLDRLSERETEVVELQRRGREAEEKYASCFAELQAAKRECEELQERLEALLSQRRELEELREMLESLRDQDDEDDNDEDYSEDDYGSETAEVYDQNQASLRGQEDVRVISTTTGSRPDNRTPADTSISESFRQEEQHRNDVHPSDERETTGLVSPHSPDRENSPIVSSAQTPISSPQSRAISPSRSPSTLGLSPAAIRSMVERNMPTSASKKRIKDVS